MDAVAVRLADAVSGKQLWGQVLDCNLQNNSMLEFENNLVGKVASTIGDIYGVIPRTLAKESLNRRADSPATDLESLRGSVCAVNSVHSHSGHNMLRAMLSDATLILRLGGPEGEVIARQRFNLNRTIRLSKRPDDPSLSTVDRIGKFEEELAEATRELAEFLDEREFDGSDLLFQAEAAML